MKQLAYVLRWSALGLMLAGLLLLGRSCTEQGGLEPAWLAALFQPGGFATAVERAAPAVVSIDAWSRSNAPANPLTDDPVFRRFFGTQDSQSRVRPTTSLGSGVILDASGVVLTNYHVVRRSEGISVTLADGRSSSAVIIGTDADTDLAVLKIEMTDLPSVVLGDSNSLRVGDIVLAIGNPLGIGQTVTQGIVSATGRNRVGINTFENFIQTDAAINFGNSGGALVDRRGALVGINSVRLESEGIGFAIPTSVAVEIARELLASGSVQRGWLGIDARDLSDTLKDMLGVSHGILVEATLSGGPADLAGIRAGDVLMTLGEHSLLDSRSAIDHIAAYAPGTRVALSGVRDGQELVTEITVSRRPAPP